MADPDPNSLPELRKLSETQVTRILVADWLKCIAQMIAEGKANGFELRWDERYAKPIGSVSVVSSQLSSGLELKVLREIEEERKRHIQVVDYSDKLKDEPEAQEIFDEMKEIVS